MRGGWLLSDFATAAAAGVPACGQTSISSVRNPTSASAAVIQLQPPAGACHAKASGPYSRPDARCTPGVLNPAVTQETIGQTICRSGWTSTVRPSTSVTEPEKLASMAAYSDARSPGD